MARTPYSYDRPTDRFAAFVETSGREIPVTLLVGGVVIVGQLAPLYRYHEWAVEQYERATDPGGSFAIDPAQPTAPPTIDQRLERKAQWEERYGEEGYEDPDELTFNELCVRNAEVQAGAPADWKRYPFLLVSSAQVAAVTNGYLKTVGSSYNS